jgi:hypothetical protein
MDGAALSTSTVTESPPTLPTRSFTVTGRVVVPFAVTVSFFGSAATPEPFSTTVQATVASLLFQPAPLGAGVRACVTFGAVLSSANETETGSSVAFPVQPFLDIEP